VSNELNKPVSLRLLFWGTRGNFSRHVLDSLLQADVDVRAVLVPAADSPPEGIAPLLPPSSLVDAHDTSDLELPLANPFAEQSTLHSAWMCDIPVYTVARLSSHGTQANALALMAELDVDVAAVACFLWRIPPTLLTALRHGFLNVHPSLLPAYRGPAPLFWILRDGAQETAGGVTVHWMDAAFDTGDMAAQTPVALPDGIRGPDADARCADAGAALLVDVLHQLAAGTASRRPQSAGGTYRSWPRASDFTLRTSWSARRAFNFMRGTADWGQPYTVRVGDVTLMLSAALSFEAPGCVPGGWEQRDGVMRVQFATGVLIGRGWMV